MMKQKMMNRFHKRNSSSASSIDFKSGERLDFKFSSLQALQVPSGWDKLSLSLISIETDKTVTKTGKASVYNGNCRWTETLSESIWLSPDDASKEHQQCLYKLLISKGSTRSSILGEATVNLSSYMSSEASLPIALPLKKCDYGTILQVAIQCLTPRPNSRWSDTNSHADSSDLDNMSEAPPNGFDTKPIGPSTSNSIRDTSSALGSRETSFATVRSHQSFDSMDSFGGESSHSNISDVATDLTGRPESTTSVNVYNSPSAGKNLLNRRQDSGKVSHNVPASPLRNFVSSDYVLEDDVATEELRAEARTWERNARKLMVDLELSRKVTSDQTRNLENVTMELSALQTECNGLKNEIKHLKVLLGESAVKERDADDLKLQVQDKNDTQKELEEEIKFQKDLNNNLSIQLNKTQEANLELVSVLQELEETIEKQKLEMNSLMASEQSAGDDENGEVHTRVEVSRITEEDKRGLELELQKFQESQEKLESTILYLEETLEAKTREIELERDLKTQTLLDIDSEWTKKLSLKDKEIFNLEAKLSEALAAPVLKETESRTIETPDLYEEVKALKDKVIELERDCNELTEENLELLFKLKESSKDLSTSGTSINCSWGERPSTEDSEVDYSSKDTDGKVVNSVIELKSTVEELNKEIFTKNFEIEELKSDCLLKEEEIQSQSNLQKDLEAQLSDLQIVNSQLEESLKVMQREVNDTKDSIISDSKILEKKLLESEDSFLNLSKNLEDLEEKLSMMLNENASKEKTFDSELNGLHLQFSELAASFESCEHQTIQLTEENSSLKVQLEKMPLLQDEILALKNSLNDVKTREIELERDLKTQNLSDIESEWTNKLSLKDKEIFDLEAKLSEALAAPVSKETESRTIETPDLYEEVKSLKDKILELERDCNELTDENLELLYKLKESNKDSEVDDNLKDNEGKFGNLIIELKSRVEELKSDCLLKEEEIQSQNCRVKDLEGQLSDLQMVNSQLEKSLTDVKESTHLETMHSESEIMKLHDEIKRLQNEVDEMQKRLLEAQEECEYFKKENPKLQATTENLLEECSELRQQRLELHNHCTNLEDKLKESEENFLKSSKNLEDLEEKLSTMLNEITSKEKTLSELESLHLKFKEENSNLEVQLQDEIMGLKDSLNDVKHENERLEEKVLRLEGDLTVKEALGAQNAELENEIEHLKRSNSQLQLKINRLEEEKDNEDESSRIQSLELALAEALEANEMYKIQLKSLLSEKEAHESDNLQVKNEGKNKQNASLEAELNELQERYLNMSLKYAEVEAQREELVLKLKASGPGRSWFS
ncbi:hypothetical protein L1887_16399 [Cichorium endivia]|nr:hypothetical protein L1887_16399 [Cichorium endivia]